MRQPKVSVIIPVYNAEATLAKCLDSFLSQTLSGWELILVDDGSADKSGMICEEYAKKNQSTLDTENAIRVLHRQNGGVSAARQTGLDVVQGEYIIHADPDDWVEPEMLEELYARAKAEDADMVICDFICDVDGKSIYRSQAPTSVYHQDVLNDLFGKIHGSCCNKLVRREAIVQSEAHFPSGINYCEDVCFNVQLLKHDIKVAYIARAYYHYVQGQLSITNNYTRKTFETQKRFVDFLSMQLPAGSEPVLKSKLLVKKLAFRHSVLTCQELRDLYPDVRKTNERIIFLTWMYDSAFNGRFLFANILLRIYKLLHR